MSGKDSEEQKTKFREDPLEYLHYCKAIESELNQRFKFILNGTPEAAQAKEVGLATIRIFDVYLTAM